MINDELFSHELVFATGYSYIVHFGEFEHWVEMIEKASQEGLGRT
jgi:hypothetical protein